jgi:perosamine synthetase
MIPLVKPLIGEEEKRLVNEVLDSGMLAQGPKVKELEEKFAALCDTKYAIGVNSGTAALHTALYAAGIRKGDEVITVPFTFVATANAVIMQGAKPVFVDVLEDTFNINPDLIQEKITKKTKAIIPVDLYGQIYDYKAVQDIAEDNKLKIIEDACQAVNATKDGKKAGSLGDLAAFSFYATKNVISGEGGMITTDNSEYVELCKRFRHHGQSEQTRYEYHDMGYNYRMMDLQAAIALGQLKKIEELTNKRIENAKILTRNLKDIPGIIVPYIEENVKHVYHQYTIKVDGFKLSREELMRKLKEKEIGCGIYYPKPLHLHPWFTKLGYKEGDFPISEKLSKEVLSLPVHPSLSKEDLHYIIKAFSEIAC